MTFCFPSPLSPIFFQTLNSRKRRSEFDRSDRNLQCLQQAQQRLRLLSYHSEVSQSEVNHRGNAGRAVTDLLVKGSRVLGSTEVFLCELERPPPFPPTEGQFGPLDLGRLLRSSWPGTF